VDPPGCPADYDRQLALIVHELHTGGAAGHSPMPDEGSGPFEEHQRFLLRAERELLCVISIVQAECNDGTRLKRR
jgi:hypothetical protein